MVAFCSTVKRLHWLFCVRGLTVNTVSRFQNRICIASQEKKKNLYIAHEEMGAATVGSR